MALKENHFDSVVALILVFLVGFGLAALFPSQEWIRTATWTVALGLAIIAVGGRWARSGSRDTDWLRLPDEEAAAPPEGDEAGPDAAGAEPDDDPSGDASDDDTTDPSSPTSGTHP